MAMDAVFRELPEIRAYEERDLTQRIARINYDYSAARRYLIENGWMTREGGIYRMTDLGQAIWRVERFIFDEYMGERPDSG